MRNHPRSFHGFALEYVINGQRSARRQVGRQEWITLQVQANSIHFFFSVQVDITGEDVTRGKLYSQLLNLPGGAAAGARYLSSEDVSRLARETTSSVVASVVTDVDYVDSSDDVSVAELVERELARQSVSSGRLAPGAWESVFWDPSWARPDRLASYLNRALRQDARDNGSFILSHQARAQVPQYYSNRIH